MSMKAFIIAAALLVAAAPAYAQPNFGDGKKTNQKNPAHEKQEEEAYKSSLRRIQPKDAPSADPWGSMRSDGTTPSPGKPKTPANTAR
jgi:hypothetical protein